MVGKDLSSAQLEALESCSERFARGELITGSKGLIFQVEHDDLSDLDIDDLQHDIQNYFSRKVSALKSARVVTRVTSHTGRWENGLSL